VSRSRRQALIGVVLVAIAAPFVVDWLWTSDEERVEASLDAMEHALEQRDAAQLEPWIVPEVTLGSISIPGFVAGNGLIEGLRVALTRVTRLSVSRDETTIDFAADGGAHVTIRGSAYVEVESGGGPLSFELEIGLTKDARQHYLLADVKRARVEPGLH